MPMTILEDTRNQATKHETKHHFFENMGVKLFRSKLPFGDYALIPEKAVDTKQNIYELAMDIDQEHRRFKAELVTAREYGCKLYILVENEDGIRCLSDLANWTESYAHWCMRVTKNPRAKRLEGARLAKACATMGERYGATFLFCTPADAADKIVRLLHGMDKA